MAIKTNENFITFSNSVTFRKPRGTDLVTASELTPGFYQSKSNVPTSGSLRTIKNPTGGQSQASNPLPLPALPPHGIYIDRCIIPTELCSTCSSILLPRHLTVSLLLSHEDIDLPFFIGNLWWGTSILTVQIRGQYLYVPMYLMFFILTFTFLIIIITVTQLVYQFSFLVILGVPLL